MITLEGTFSRILFVGMCFICTQKDINLGMPPFWLVFSVHLVSSKDTVDFGFSWISCWTRLVIGVPG